MGFKKCPKCELNYIRDDEQFCNVCKRGMKGEPDVDDSVAICTECGENPAVRGSELCAVCLREVRRQENLEKLADELDSSVDNMDELDELEVPIEDDDIPEMELEEIDKELGGDDMDDDFDDMDDEEEVEED